MLFVESPVARGAVFTQDDFSKFIEINTSIQSLKQDVTATLKRFPATAVERVLSYAHLEVTLEAIQERLNAVLILVTTSAAMELLNDQLRVINTLSYMLEQTKLYLISKRRGITDIAAVQSYDGMYASYSVQATGIIDRANLVVDEYILRISALKRKQ
jgi:hypothetical protein